jgi:hypothetical protein
MRANIVAARVRLNNWDCDELRIRTDERRLRQICEQTANRAVVHAGTQTE